MENKQKKPNAVQKIILPAAAVILLVAAAYFVGMFSSAGSATVPDARANAALLTEFDYGDRVTYVIGHKSPDTDTVTSAIAMADFLNRLGIKAEARMAGKANGETNYIAAEFGIALPEILSDAEGQQLWLVDHSEYSQSVAGAEDARIVGILDHHGMGNTDVSEQIYVNSAKAGATATLIWKLYKDCGVAVDKATAQTLLCGILSDTSYGKKKSLTALDEEALEELQGICGIQDTAPLCEGMKEAKLAYTGMTDEDIYYNDYKEYETEGGSYAIGLATTKTLEEVDGMADRMEAVLQEKCAETDKDFLAAMVYNADYDYGRLIFVGKDEALIKALVSDAFLTAEDYSASEDNTVIFKPSVGRKAVIVPCINDFLKTYTDN